MYKQIVCQDTLDDDSSAGNAVEDRAENDLPREDLRANLASEADAAHDDNEFDGFSDAYNSRKREQVGRTVKSVHSYVPEDKVILPISAEASHPYGSGSRGQSPMYSGGNSDSPRDERYEPSIN